MDGTRGSLDAATTSARVNDSGSSSAAKYEVFLSFISPGMKETFIEFLHRSLVKAGIQVFRDDGEKIGGEILSAIESCKIYLPIFSRNYASSAWCLRKLTHMVKCSSKEIDKMILPIFYDVKPDDVKLRDDVKHKSLYLHDLEKHKEKFSQNDVHQWKDALIEATRIKGWDFQTSGHREFIISIVSEVLKKLKKRRILPDQLVGIHDHVKAFLKLSYIGSPYVPYLIIHGMGGIGKTTLASAVFNQICNQFDVCSFLSDVRESARRGRIMDLQKQLLSELHLGKSPEIHDSVHAGINIISTRFRDKKVLLILDDVDTWEQVCMLAGKDWFGPGSKIIITTRYINFLPIKEEEEEGSFQGYFEEFRFYEMTGMDSFQALELFSKHSLGMVFPPQRYDVISREITSKVGGLPLVLEVIGSSLWGKSKTSWEETLKKLDMVPNQNVLDKLKISYDMLDHCQRQIFLDIACFFIGEEQLLPYCMWKASNYFPKVDLRALTRISLIKIVKNDTLWMHDQLRDLGREIIQRENVNEPGQRSRLWEPKIAFDVVRMKEGTNNVIALGLRGLSEEHKFTSEEFLNLPNLRFLELDGGNLVGDFKNLFSKLKWLSWSNCPSELDARNLCLEELVVLELSGNNITKDWAGWETYLVSKNLKVIRITQCSSLRGTPDLSKCTKLKRFVLQGGKSSIVINGSLSKLVIDGLIQDKRGSNN